VDAWAQSAHRVPLAGRRSGQTAVFANELASMRPDILLSRNTPATAALKRLGIDIPIVFVMVVDPLSTRLVESLARPGGTTTGFTNFEHAMAGKWLDLLKQVSPSIQRVAFFFNPKTAPYAPGLLDYVNTAAPAKQIKPIWVPVEDVAAFADKIVAVAGEPNTGLVALPDTFVVEHRAIMIELAARHRMPAVYPNPVCVRDGGLMAYGIDNPDLFYRAATYIDRILKGANPGELPVQQPNKFQLLINMKTANALGLAVPPTMLVLADEVIE
jgi:putative ABC transport system substrate-binding protein